MKFIDEFRNQKLILAVAEKIRQLAPAQRLSIMEVCGTHTQSFFRFGLRRLLPSHIRLIAGPGCPVCVSAQEYIDQAIWLAMRKDTLVVTFGDMLRVPGSRGSLEQAKSAGAQVRVVYSPFDSLKIAKAYPRQKVIFLGVGFETTAAPIALSILMAQKEKLKNISFFVSLKLIPPAMRFLLQDKRVKINGFLCPGHVSAIIGTNAYRFIADKYRIPCCVAGFEPLDIMEGLYLIIRQIVTKKPLVENQYARVVMACGNKKAQAILRRVFKVSPASWRGLGVIAQSGLSLRKEFAGFDAARIFKPRTLYPAPSTQRRRCRCGDVLKGIISPPECRQFGKSCLPDNPIGPCMVSFEGACNAYYKYQRGDCCEMPNFASF